MKEQDFLKIISDTLAKSAYIGDDCAYLKDLGIVVTQDSLVQDIHFSLDFSTPYGLGYRAIVVNLSDIFASGAVPKYITISLSLPKDINDDFVREFYRACDELSNEYDFEVVGGDITGSDKIFISVCAIGITKNRKISSRSNAKVGDYIISTGDYGASAAGLWALQNDIKFLPELVEAHLKPVPQKAFSSEIATQIERDYAMMDTSDGLTDALFKIAQASNVSMNIDFAKIPYSEKTEKAAIIADTELADWVLYGGEDFQMIACIDEENLSKIKTNSTIIGRVEEKQKDYFVKVNFDDEVWKVADLNKTFDHFKEEK